MEQTLQQIQSLLVNAGGKILLALAVWIVGRFVISKITGSLNKLPSVRKMDETVRSFLNSFVKILLNIILVISIVSILGVPMTSVIAVLASAGVTIGMALQGALGNLAGGIISAFAIVCLRVGLGQRNVHAQVVLLIVGALLIAAVALPNIIGNIRRAVKK